MTHVMIGSLLVALEAHPSSDNDRLQATWQDRTSASCATSKRRLPPRRYMAPESAGGPRRGQNHAIWCITGPTQARVHLHEIDVHKSCDKTAQTTALFMEIKPCLAPCMTCTIPPPGVGAGPGAGNAIHHSPATTEQNYPQSPKRKITSSFLPRKRLKGSFLSCAAATHRENCCATLPSSSGRTARVVTWLCHPAPAQKGLKRGAQSPCDPSTSMLS
mmetsp:Transcript_47795/g.126538  ORF Transcript_47795/g.126538 Transcript_47795/m.126538 type:complete len:217 (-) Transcript_47795:104-754(-)